MVTVSPQKITPFLMFEGSAEQAMTFYTEVFAEAEIVAVDRYGPGEDGAEGSVRHASFSLAGQRFMCIDSPVSHGFGFTPSLSLYVECDSEQELERLHARLSEQGAELMPLGDYGFSTRFAWVSDRFGVSWQLNLA